MSEDGAADDRTSLLSNHTTKVNVNAEVDRCGIIEDDGSAEAVGSLRGLCIVLCLWLLIFLQGMFV